MSAAEPRSRDRAMRSNTSEAGISVMRSTASQRRSTTHTCTFRATGAKAASAVMDVLMALITPQNAGGAKYFGWEAD